MRLFKKMVPEIRKKRYSNEYHCPHCSSSMVVRYGSYRQRQRYPCKDCRKTFTYMASTALNFVHDKGKFFAALLLMLWRATLEEIAKEVCISVPTAFSWRHKILDGLKNIEDEDLFGIMEADDIFLLASKKSSKNLDRKPRKRGGKSKKRGISRGQVCVLAARDKKSHTLSDIANFGC
ncbi:MAG: transposase [Actinomycetota bacterium]